MSGGGAVKKKVAKISVVAKAGVKKKVSKPVRAAKSGNSARAGKPARPVKVAPARRKASTEKRVVSPRVGGAAAAPAPEALRAVPQPAARREAKYAGLTESDLRRAPQSQYMKSGQLGYFRELLRSMQRELLDKAGLTSEHLREHETEPDPTDQATIEEEYALELRARDRERKLLKKIEQSLRHIDEGSYGYCEETGEAIGIPRLLARPTATLTIEAQSRRELKQKLYGD
jgi:DnaK suppressor protein